MMAMNPREKDFQAKRDGDPNYNKFPKFTSSSRQWSSYKNPRIIRVSRDFGGKDRHSKVCTLRGLRDRRIRLSVPTAIQLYDLQDKLGLSQPSKVVDWLLDATKDEIDKLPPLPMIPGSFTPFHQPTLACQDSSGTINPQNPMSHFLATNHPFAKNLGISTPRKDGIIKIDEDEKEMSTTGKEKWIFPQQEQENQEGFGGFVAQLSAQNLFPLSNINHQSSSIPNLGYNSYFHCWDPPNLSLSQFGGGFPFPNQTDEQQQQQQPYNTLSTFNLPTSSQLYFCPSATALPASIIPSFPSYISTPSLDNYGLRQFNHHHQLQQNPQLLPTTTLHLINPTMKSFALNVNSKTVNHSQDQKAADERRNKDHRNT